jgi:hypothetical protein
MRPKPKKSLGACLAVVLVVLAVFVAQNTNSQGGQGQEPSQEEIMQMMGPMMGTMMKNMIDAMLETMAKPETAEQLATFSKNYYDALIAKGFSKDEAMRIVTSVGMPSIPSMR